MSTKFVLTRDINGAWIDSTPFAQDGYGTTLAVSAAQSIVVPDNFPNWEMYLTYSDGANVWVDGITTAVIPSTSFSVTTAQLNPLRKSVKAGQVISFITADADTPYVSVQFYVKDLYTN